MRHRVLKYKLNRTSSHRKALLNNMALALIKHEQISTTLVKAKNLRPFVEKIITLAKKGSLSSKKKAFSILKNKKITDKLFTIIAKRYESRKGGYVKILKNGFRYGDMAPLAVIELVDRDEKAKGLDSGPVQKKKVDNIDNNEKETATDQELKKNEKDQKVPEKELKENEEIAKKLEKKKDK
ncbi:MAG: 50S ribosomal protein L17 [Pelagibacteraceae bacterium]|jgi:large subunit ribosomal protein L17|nr:50S ribosomal protein L17 [Pelagibacteraceae bacterium]|tara:strand:- start:910 stop:1455 length:546 start_codon:yes stop_codon:yes gene_type:complete